MARSTPSWPVARGPVPRDRCLARRTPSRPVARGPVPRERFVPEAWRGKLILARSAGACPPRSLAYPRHGEGQALALRETGGVFFTVARGTGPRDRSGTRSTARGTSYWPVARGPVPRDRCLARDRPSPYGNERRFFHRSAGDRPPRLQHGEGQALALRYFGAIVARRGDPGRGITHHNNQHPQRFLRACGQ